MVDTNQGLEDIPRHEQGRMYRLLTLRFLPKRDQVPKVLIHLFSHIFHRHASLLQASSITMAVRSDFTCPALIYFATGNSSVLRYAIFYRWPVTLIWSGLPGVMVKWEPQKIVDPPPLKYWYKFTLMCIAMYTNTTTNNFRVMNLLSKVFRV